MATRRNLDTYCTDAKHWQYNFKHLLRVQLQVCLEVSTALLEYPFVEGIAFVACEEAREVARDMLV